MVEELSREYPVYVTDVRDLPSALKMIRDLGTITGNHKLGLQLTVNIENELKTVVPLHPARRCAYLIWRKPWMAVGADTFINSMLEQCGLINIAADWSGRYPEFDLKALVDANPEIVLLSSEPFPFEEKHLLEISEALPLAKVILVDGEMFSWYGSHLLKAPPYLNDLLNRLKL
jgi:ABC-type Fe3+-hydroxamate transport system substrate-binding protein